MKTSRPILLLSLFVLVLAGQTLALPGGSTLNYTDDFGSWTETELGDPPEVILGGNPIPLDCEVLWNYHVDSGTTPKVTVLGYNDDYVWNGGWWGKARMFEVSGSGTPLWEFDFGSGGFGVAAAQTADIFYGAWHYQNTSSFEVYKFNHASNIPDWTWDGTAAGYVPGGLDSPGRMATSADGSVLAVGGNDGDSLAVMFFTDSSSTPTLIYEDESIAYNPRQLRLTADGSKCIFTCAGDLYRVDVATGVLEDFYDIGYSSGTLGVSPDGSIVVLGFSTSRVLQWNGSEYVSTFVTYNSGHYAGGAAVAADNDTVAIAWYASDYLSVSLSMISIANGSTPLWVWDSLQGGGGNQASIAQMDISDDGNWVAFGNWGVEDSAFPEAMVFKSDTAAGPWFSIDTPGSVFSVDLSSDGEYLCTGGKAVHANEMGSGGDVYAVHIDQTSAVESVDMFADARDEGILLSWSIVGDEPAELSVLRELTPNGSVDISGALSGSSTSWLDVSAEAGMEYAYYLEVTELDGTVSRFGPSEIVVPGAVSELTLSDPYPNPASSALTISYELATDGAVSLSVYDLSGRLVETLVSGEQTAGRHSVSWDSSTSATGVYLIRLEAAGEAITKRAVISR
ncbi:T9SS type A sorting domain-containing protein [bacterium]|nr:T9SS type A sorting domain-containing protein [bacterium]